MVGRWSCGVLLSVQKLKNKLQLAARYVHNRGFTRGYSPSKDQIRGGGKETIIIFLSVFSRENNLQKGHMKTIC